MRAMSPHRPSPARALALAACSAGFLACLPGGAFAASSTAVMPEGHVPRQVIVRFDPGTSAARKAAARRAVAGTLGRRLALPNAELLQLRRPATVKRAVAALRHRPEVRYAEANVYAAPQSCPVALISGQCRPNDPRFNQQWSLFNTGQAIDANTGSAADADIDMTEAWNITQGTGNVIVAIVDSGIEEGHPDFAGRIWNNAGEKGTDAQGRDKRSNGVDDDRNGYVDDWHGWDVVGNSVLNPNDSDNDPHDVSGHGTHVAGIVGAIGHNAKGVAGVAWNVQLMNVRVRAERSNETSADIADAFAYAARNGARIANVSLAELERSQVLEDTINAHPETLFVIASGNLGQNLDQGTNASWPCEYPSPNVLCVAATGRRDELAQFSNYSPTSVDLAAPGMITISTFPAFTTLSTDKFDTDPFAAPARWLRGANPGFTNRFGLSTAFKNAGSALTNNTTTVDQPGSITWVENATPYNLTGRYGCEVQAYYWMNDSPGSGIFVQARRDRNFMAPSRTPSQDTPRPANDTIAFATGPLTRRKLHPNISDLDGSAAVYLRYGMMATSTAGAAAPRAYIDDSSVRCISKTYSANGVTETSFEQGTSMATPHVAGVAALILSMWPDETTAQLKADLMRAVDPLPSLAGKTVTGGRLNAYKALARTTVGVVNGVLTVRAGHGTRNALTVSRLVSGTAVSYRVKDPFPNKGVQPMSGSRLEPGAGCTAVSDTEVNCPATGITSVDVDANDLDDTVTATGVPIPVMLAGGDGVDTLTGGTAADTFRGGPGNDTINSRDALADTLFDCGEGPGTDTDRVLADTKDVIAASATNCESVAKA